jgi:hypothetical protein
MLPEMEKRGVRSSARWGRWVDEGRGEGNARNETDHERLARPERADGDVDQWGKREGRGKGRGRTNRSFASSAAKILLCNSEPSTIAPTPPTNRSSGTPCSSKPVSDETGKKRRENEEATNISVVPLLRSDDEEEGDLTGVVEDGDGGAGGCVGGQNGGERERVGFGRGESCPLVLWEGWRFSLACRKREREKSTYNMISR